MKCPRLTNVFLIVFVIATAITASAQKLKPEEIIGRHLDSIGKPGVRSSVKTLLAVGNATVTYISSKNHPANGRVVLASAGEKIFFGMNLNASDYPFEKVSFNGEETKVSFVRPGQRSVLGSFMLSNDVIFKNGLFSGVLSTSWPLSDANFKKAKLSSAGLKKVGEIEAYAINYTPKGGSDLDITLYFDKTTFRHLRTEYQRISSAGIGRTIDESARQHETRIKLIENFGDFKEVKGLTIPAKYELHYSISGANGTTEVEWTYVLTDFLVNQPLDDKTFDADAK